MCLKRRAKRLSRVVLLLALLCCCCCSCCCLSTVWASLSAAVKSTPAGGSDWSRASQQNEESNNSNIQQLPPWPDKHQLFTPAITKTKLNNYNATYFSTNSSTSSSSSSSTEVSRQQIVDDGFISATSNELQPQLKLQHEHQYQRLFSPYSQVAQQHFHHLQEAVNKPVLLFTEQQAQQIAAFNLIQEANIAANKINADLCRNFSIGIQDKDGGSFTSPNYPNAYPVNLSCTRLIEAPPGYSIVLEFRDQFNIEDAGLDCDNDRIEVRDGRYGYSKVLARYCGTKFPPEVKSTNEAMWLRFVSDSSIPLSGFKAVYRFEKQKNIKPNPPFECRFNVTSMTNVLNHNSTDNRTGIHSGVIRHTDIPDKLIDYTKTYNVSLECIWNITVMPGWKIYLTFANYELNKPNDCDSNFIEIYEENLTEENQTVKFCGTRTEPQQSKSNIFNIRHHALPTAPGSRFEIIYTAFREKGSEGCESREFDCDDGTCIHESLKCDGQVNCKYRYDETSDPGPCQGDVEGAFFETEHMVIILIVFLTLVGGMCASIIVSCWGKIQERRRNKLEFYVRKSREASMEHQINKAVGDQPVYGPASSDRSSNSAANKHRISSAVGPSDSLVQQQLTNRYPLKTATSGSLIFLDADSLQLQQQQHLSSNQQYAAQHQAMMNQLLAENGNYGILGANQHMMASSNSLDVKGELIKRDDLQQQQQQQLNLLARQHDLAEFNAQDVNKSLQNVQQSLRASLAAQQKAKQANDIGKQQQSVPDISFKNQFNPSMLYGAGGIVADNQMTTNESHLVTQDAHNQQQQMLNLTLAARNHLSQQQQHNYQLSSIYQQRQLDNNNNSNSNNNNISNNTNSNNNNNNNNNTIAGNSSVTNNASSNMLSAANHYGRFLRHQQNVGGTETGISNEILNQPSSAQTMPIHLAKYNLIKSTAAQLAAGGSSQVEAQLQAEAAAAASQKLNYGSSVRSQFANIAAYNSQRALTLSSMHQPLFDSNQLYQRNLQAIYGIHPNSGQPVNVNNHLSSSMTCCNLQSDYLNETPLICDRLVQGNQQQQLQRVQVPQNSQMYELRSATLGPRVPSAAIPRSISAHQLSRSQIRQNQHHHQQQQQQQQQNQQQETQQQQQQQSLQQQHQPPYKSISDAGQVAKHQPPNHSLSYPHACTGSHSAGQQRGQSPALPPPPPPPNLVQTRSATACGTHPTMNQQLNNSRTAFKLSRLDQSQLTATSEMLQDQDMLMAGLPFGSMQFDEPSTESDGTFSMLAGNAVRNAAATASVGTSAISLGHSYSVGGQAHQQQPLFMAPSLKNIPHQGTLAHLSECNLIRRQRSLMKCQDPLPSNQPLLCNCGALDRGNQLQKQQQQQQQQQQLQQYHQGQQLQQVGHDFDDSDDGVGLIQAQYGRQPSSFASLELNNLALSQVQAGKDHQQPHSNIIGSLYNRQRRDYARFKQQSSDMTGDDGEAEDDDDVDDDDQDDDDVDEEELERYQLGMQDDELSSDALALHSQAIRSTKAVAKSVPLDYRARSVVRNKELLRDDPNRHLSGSHTSISCQSCICGSQLRLDHAGVEDESSESKSGGQEGSQQIILAENSLKQQNQIQASSVVNTKNNKCNFISENAQAAPVGSANRYVDSSAIENQSVDSGARVRSVEQNTTNTTTTPGTTTTTATIGTGGATGKARSRTEAENCDITNTSSGTSKSHHILNTIDN